MCAIMGEVACGYTWADAAVLSQMQAAMWQRGPDQQGQVVLPHAALAHDRLSVVDLEGGRQPMQWGPLTLVYNGELYNAHELRQELAAIGHTFEGHSDTEVLLHALAEWDICALAKLNGIYAFALWDSAHCRLMLARDRMGVKPLFFTVKGEHLIFASELRGLLAHPAVEPVVDAEGRMEVLMLGPGRTPGCGVFRNVQEVLPGEYLLWQGGDVTRRHYWQLQDREHTESVEDTIEHVRYLVTDAIDRQMVSDVPLCTFLSGGLDSSIISAVVADRMRIMGQQLHTFSVDYRENDRYFVPNHFQPAGDNDFIRQMVEAIGSAHHRVELAPEEVADALDEAVLVRGLPGMADVDSSLLLFCRAVKEHATVALSGECADEIFGGYPWYRDPLIRDRPSFPWAQSTALRMGLVRPEALEGDGEAAIAARYAATCASAPMRSGLDGVERRMREMMKLNLDWFMQTLLDRKDRMSMASSLEVRVPFCDHRIVEYLYSVPWTMKDLDGREKGLLRAAMGDWLPETVRERKKSPYPKVVHPAYLALMQERVEQLLAEPQAPVWQLVKPEAVRPLLTEDLPMPWYGQLMTRPQTLAYLWQLDVWLRTFEVRLV